MCMPFVCRFLHWTILHSVLGLPSISYIYMLGFFLCEHVLEGGFETLIFVLLGYVWCLHYLSVI